MRINTKIAAGFSVVLAIMIGVGTFGYFGIAHVGEDFESYAQRVAVVDAVSEIDREFLSYRRLVREVAANQDAESAAKLAEEEEQRVKAAIDHGINEIHNPERHAKIEEIKAKFDEYAALARKAGALREEKDKIGHAVLDVDGAKLKANLEHLLKVAARDGDSNTLVLGNEALKEVMQIRLSVNTMLGRHDIDAKSAADHAFEEVNLVLATLDKLISTPDARKDFEEVKKLIAEYHDGYQKAAAIDHELDEIMGTELPKLAEVVAEDTRKIRETATADEKALERDAMALIHSTEVMMLASGIGGVLLGTVLA
jgi:CHASE3 domain sensor protein